MTEWKIGGRDISGHITSLKCSECGYRIKPDFRLRTCPNCHVEIYQGTVQPHYQITDEGNGWSHYILVAPNKLMKVTIDDFHLIKGVTDVWTNDKTREMRVRLFNDVEHYFTFTSFTITSYDDRKEAEDE